MTFVNQIRLHRSRFAKTIGLLSCYMALSMLGGTIGPSLLDLRQQVDTDITTISFALTARAGGHAIGSLISEYSLIPH